MDDAPAWRYYAAVFASLLSTLAWLAAALGVGYLGYRGLSGLGVSRDAIGWVLILIALGAMFAKLEHRLYRSE